MAKILNVSRAVATMIVAIACWSGSQRADAITSTACTGYGGTLGLGNCYVVDTTLRTWSDSESAAQALDPVFHLASIHSSAENSFVSDLLLPDTNEYWIGLSDVVSEGTFVWSDATSNVYQNWAPGEPSGTGNADYVVLDPTTGKWNDFANTNYFGAVYSATVVPLPAAVWLFGSGLLGLVGMARRKKAA